MMKQLFRPILHRLFPNAVEWRVDPAARLAVAYPFTLHDAEWYLRLADGNEERVRYAAEMVLNAGLPTYYIGDLLRVGRTREQAERRPTPTRDGGGTEDAA